MKLFEYHIWWVEKDMFNNGYGFWFRVFGYGVEIKTAKNHIKLYSERNGYRKAYYMFGLRFEFLKPWKLLSKKVK